ncbi:MAG: hypothetical protein J7513_13240 [Solirubrobacteraceae bacterium]|nr:hypothetical protein [Solirubrobacteraceae bacterium]
MTEGEPKITLTDVQAARFSDLTTRIDRQIQFGAAPDVAVRVVAHDDDLLDEIDLEADDA